MDEKTKKIVEDKEKKLAELRKSGPVKVRVKSKGMKDGFFGYYGEKRRRPGDVFVINSMADFSSKWMIKVDVAIPLRESTVKRGETIPIIPEVNDEEESVEENTEETPAGDEPLDETPPPAPAEEEKKPTGNKTVI